MGKDLVAVLEVAIQLHKSYFITLELTFTYLKSDVAEKEYV